MPGSCKVNFAKGKKVTPFPLIFRSYKGAPSLCVTSIFWGKTDEIRGSAVFCSILFFWVPVRRDPISIVAILPDHLCLLCDISSETVCAFDEIWFPCGKQSWSELCKVTDTDTFKLLLVSVEISVFCEEAIGCHAMSECVIYCITSIDEVLRIRGDIVE